MKAKLFCIEDLIWKANLPIGERNKRYGKWSINWIGPFVVQKVLRGSAYQLRDIEGEVHSRLINGQYLKPHYPKLWEIINLEYRSNPDLEYDPIINYKLE